MMGSEKAKMLEIIKKYIEDVEYRKSINDKDFSSLKEIEQIALKGLLVSHDGVEIINSDFSNYYSPYNPVNVNTERNLELTCMNMAVAYLLHEVFKDNNIDKYASFNFRDIKSRVKGDLFCESDKPVVIDFIREYHGAFPKYLPKKSEEYRKMYYGHIRNGFGAGHFIALAKTFNTNIYLGELGENHKEKVFSKIKK